jgi:hypothetical protein
MHSITFNFVKKLREREFSTRKLNLMTILKLVIKILILKEKALKC